MPSTRTIVKRSKEKEHKLQLFSVAENIFMRSFTSAKSYMLQKMLEISTRSSHTMAQHGMPNVLEDFSCVSHLCNSYRDASDEIYI